MSSSWAATRKDGTEMESKLDEDLLCLEREERPVVAFGVKYAVGSLRAECRSGVGSGRSNEECSAAENRISEVGEVTMMEWNWVVSSI